MKNPFILGLAQGSKFCNRRKELQELYDFAASGRSVVLYSPRRYGKSSLVTSLCDRLQNDGYVTAYSDLFPITSEQEVVSRLAAAILAGIGKGADPQSARQKVSGIFSRLIPSVEITREGMNFSVRFDRETKTETLLDDVVGGLFAYLERSGKRACVVLDEFQEITELKASKRIEGTLRAHLQRHETASFFFVGSRRHILKDMFTNKTRPFYKSAFLYTLDVIPKSEFASCISDMFTESGKTCLPEAAEAVYDMARGYSGYVQRLAALSWDLTEDTCDIDDVKAAYDAMLAGESADFEGILGGLSLVQKAVLKALAKEPTKSPYAKTYLSSHGLYPSSAQKAMQSLLDRDLLERDREGRYRLTDPVLGDWLAQSA